ncbi:MAG: hypothetical protein Q9218_001902 [Villophora microphyllina]
MYIDIEIDREDYYFVGSSDDGPGRLYDIMKSDIVRALNFNFSFSNWAELLAIKERVAAYEEDLPGMHRAINIETHLAKFKDILGGHPLSKPLKEEYRAPLTAITNDLDTLRAKINHYSKTIEFDLVEICDLQIASLRDAVVDNDPDQEHTISTWSRFIPGEHVIFHHDPKVVYLDESLEWPVFKPLGFNEDSSADWVAMMDEESELESESDEDSAADGEGDDERIVWASSRFRKAQANGLSYSELGQTQQGQ